MALAHWLTAVQPLSSAKGLTYGINHIGTVTTAFSSISSHSAADFQANGLQEEKGKEGTPLSE